MREIFKGYIKNILNFSFMCWNGKVPADNGDGDGATIVNWTKKNMLICYCNSYLVM